MTAADQEAERALRQLIEARYPDHGISGEEFPDRPARGRWSWSLDPVDGTRAFICGVPTWTTLIALLDEGRPVLGIVDAPAMDELYLGHGGEALLRRGAAAPEAIRASGCARLAEARLTATDPAMFAGEELEGFERLRRAALVTRYGLDGYGYARLAAGSIDLVVEAGLKPHDYNALIPLVRAAGGTIGDWQGGEDFERGRVLAAASPPLFDEALGLLSGR